MRTLQTFLALSCALLASPALAYEETGFDLSVHYGADKYDSLGLKSGIGGLKGSALLEGTSTHVGATAIYRGGLLELGVIGEIGRPGQDGSTTLLGALAGVGFGTGLRLELLGELGAHRYGDLLKDARVLTRSKSEVWLVSAGLRPGLSMRFGPDGMLIVGVWAFARWDVTSENVQVTLASGNATYKLGGSQFGGSLRLGVAL
ncbi:MAG: hypothetical protein HZB56_08295 [Deltaproteobacteria bacterium]|nr:hypothetical protein [Deltaproteobacteria bacterium]